MMTVLCVTGCVAATPEPSEPPPISGAVICIETQAERTSHAAALERDGGPDSIRTGVALIKKLDAGCAG
jgi:hypothetical protein